MKNSLLLIFLSFSFFLTFSACGNGGGGTAEIENTDIVESGTYTGVADEVDPEEKEIYLKTDDNKTLELYFTDQTQLMQNGQTVGFEALQKGQRLQVQLEKKGQRLEPISVTILQ